MKKFWNKKNKTRKWTAKDLLDYRFPAGKEYMFYLCLAQEYWRGGAVEELNNYIEISNDLKDIRADKTIPINELK